MIRDFIIDNSYNDEVRTEYYLMENDEMVNLFNSNIKNKLGLFGESLEIDLVMRYLCIPYSEPNRHFVKMIRRNLLAGPLVQ